MLLAALLSCGDAPLRLETPYKPGLRCPLDTLHSDMRFLQRYRVKNLQLWLKETGYYQLEPGYAFAALHSGTWMATDDKQIVLTPFGKPAYVDSVARLKLGGPAGDSGWVQFLKPHSLNLKKPVPPLSH